MPATITLTATAKVRRNRDVVHSQGIEAGKQRSENGAGDVTGVDGKVRGA